MIAIRSYQLVTEVGQTDQVLLDIQPQPGAPLRHETQQRLHLLLGDELLVFQEVSQARSGM